MNSFQTFAAFAVLIATLIAVMGLSRDVLKRMSDLEKRADRIAGMLVALLEANSIDPVTLRSRNYRPPRAWSGEDS